MRAEQVELSLKELTDRYIRPAARRLAREWMMGYPLTDLEHQLISEAMLNRAS